MNCGDYLTEGDYSVLSDMMKEELHQIRRDYPDVFSSQVIPMSTQHSTNTQNYESSKRNSGLVQLLRNEMEPEQSCNDSLDPMEAEVDKFLSPSLFKCKNMCTIPTIEKENGVPKADQWWSWWQKGCVMFPFFAILARRYLCIRPSEAGLERVLSLCKRVASDTRAGRLNPTTFEALVSLKMNFDFANAAEEREKLLVRVPKKRSRDSERGEDEIENGPPCSRLRSAIQAHIEPK